MKKTFLVPLLFSCLYAYGQIDSNKPFGFAVCTSMTDATPYNLNGGDLLAQGSQSRAITLKSNGQDMREEIMDAIMSHDVVTFDGSNGEFLVSSTMRMRDLRNKSLRGINNATIRTAFQVTPEMHRQLDSIGVKRLSTSSDGTLHTLSNGNKVREECEARVRQFLIDYLHDEKEDFRNCGLFNLYNAENIIIQNLNLIGPGAIDISGSDLINLSRCRHIWVDHCDFLDGVDGNFDINSFSDLITVSWCHFHYSERTYNHANTNLVGSNDRAESNGEDALNTTFAYCHWGKGCQRRMPMVRFGTIHLLNNYYDCVGNSSAMNPRRHSEFLIEGNYFAKGVKHIFNASDDANAYVFRNNFFTEKFQPSDKGSVSVPYKYKVIDPELLARKYVH